MAATERKPSPLRRFFTIHDISPANLISSTYYDTSFGPGHERPLYTINYEKDGEENVVDASGNVLTDKKGNPITRKTSHSIPTGRSISVRSTFMFIAAGHLVRIDSYEPNKARARMRDQPNILRYWALSEQRFQRDGLPGSSSLMHTRVFRTVCYL